MWEKRRESPAERFITRLRAKVEQTIIFGTILAIGAILVEQNYPGSLYVPQGPKPLPKADGELVPKQAADAKKERGEDPEVKNAIASLKRLEAALQSKSSDMPVFFRREGNALQRCNALSNILLTKKTEIADVGIFLGSNIEKLSDPELKEQMRAQLKERFKMTPQEIAQLKKEARVKLDENLDQARGMIAGCSFVVRGLFLVASKKFEGKYADNTLRVTREIIRAAEAKGADLQAQKAAVSLARVVDALNQGIR